MNNEYSIGLNPLIGLNIRDSITISHTSEVENGRRCKCKAHLEK